MKAAPPDLLPRVGWSLSAASVWTWGLLLLRMVRDGWQPLEVWFSYSLSFLMTAVYVYLGLLIYATVRRESGQSPATLKPALAAARRPIMGLGLVGLAVAAISLVAWLVFRFPSGPDVARGAVASVVLALMILGVVAACTRIAAGARPVAEPGSGPEGRSVSERSC